MHHLNASRRRVLTFAALLFASGSALAANLTEFIWSGAVTPNSVRVKTRPLADSTQVRLVVSTSSTLSNPIYSAYAGASSSTNDRVADLALSGLSPNTQYHYAIEIGGQLDDRRGTFKTFPSGAASFKIVFGACAGNAAGDNAGGSASDHPIFDKLREEAPLFYLNTGDIHYTDIGTNDVARFRTAFKTLFTSIRQRALYEKVPLVYVWDDHDYGPNDSDSSSPARPAARSVYQEYVPHYPLAAGSGQVPIYQAFTVGRVKVILADQRSEKSPRSNTDNATKTVLGSAQKAWLKNQLLDGRDNHALTLWVGSFPWIVNPTVGDDSWGGYTTERTELADYIKANAITNLVMLSGDAHMVAADNGNNNNYASGGGGGFPVFHAAALQRPGSVKGGPYSQGSFPNPDKTHGQYGVFEVTDTGGTSLGYTFTGKRVSSLGSVSTLLTFQGSVTVAGTETQTLVPLGASWKYNATGTDLGTAWRATAYSDSAWPSGLAPLGYGDPVATSIGFGSNSNNKYPTTYFRRAFNVANPAAVRSLSLGLRRDDGAVVYLNGVEVARSNMPAGTVSYSTYASSAVGGGDETAVFTFALPPSLLVSGTNVLAVEIHQNIAYSSDLVFDARLLAEVSATTPPPTTEQTLVALGASWKYNATGTDLGSAWRATAFSDSAWPAGPAPLGFGDPVTTTLGFGPDSNNKYPTTYFRRAFNVATPSAVQSLRLGLRRDDGAVVYLNGVEVVRSNMPAGTISYSTYASSAVGGSDETTVFNFTVSPTLLVTGTNVLAVEIHQNIAYSSDLVFDARLLAEVSASFGN